MIRAFDRENLVPGYSSIACPIDDCALIKKRINFGGIFADQPSVLSVTEEDLVEGQLFHSDIYLLPRAAPVGCVKENCFEFVFTCVQYSAADRPALLLVNQTYRVDEYPSRTTRLGWRILLRITLGRSVRVVIFLGTTGEHQP